MPERIDLRTYKNAVPAFCNDRRCSEDPTYEDEFISVRPRKPVVGGTSPGLLEGANGDDHGHDMTQGNSSTVHPS